MAKSIIAKEATTSQLKYPNRSAIVYLNRPYLSATTNATAIELNAQQERRGAPEGGRSVFLCGEC